MTDTNAHRSLRNKAARILALAAHLAVVCLILTDLTLMSGVVEQRLIPALSERFLGARTTVWFEGRNPRYVRGVQIQQADATPLLQIDAVALNFRHQRLTSLPRLATVRVWGVCVHLDATDAANPNHAFLRPFWESDAPPRDFSNWLPERLFVSDIAVRADTPDGSAYVKGLRLTADIDAMNAFVISVDSDRVLGGWHDTTPLPTLPEVTGTASATLQRTADTVSMNADLSLPDLLMLQGKADVAFSPTPQLTLDMDSIRLDAPVFGALAAFYAPVETRFERAAIAPLRLHAAMTESGPVVTDAQFDAQLAGLVVGNTEAPWYAGDFHLAATGSHEAHAEAQWTAAFHNGQQLTGAVRTNDGGLTLEAALNNWNRTHIEALWPAPLKAFEPYIPPVKRTDVTLALTIRDGAVRFEGGATPVTASETTAALGISGTHVLSSGETTLEGLMEIGAGHCTMEAAITTDAGLAAEIAAADLSVAEMLTLTPWAAYADDIQATVTGAMEITREGRDMPYHYTVTAATAEPGYGAWTLPESAGIPELTGSGTLTNDIADITATGTLQLADSATIAIERLHYNLDEARMTVTFDGTAALDVLGAAFDQDTLWGDVHTAGTVTLKDWQHGEIAPLQVTFDSLGYGALSLPYGQPLVINAPLQFDMTALTLSTGAIEASLGADTHLSTATVDINRESIVAEAPILFETGFAPMVAKQYLSAATGKLNVSLENFRYDAGTLAGTLHYDGNASHLSLPQGLADMHGLTASGAASLHPAPHGEGHLKVDKASVGGITLRNSTGMVHVEEDTLMIEDIHSDLLGGGVIARATLQPFKAGLPFMVSGEARNIDLQLFTNEFDPPSLILTGRVNGAFAVGLTMHRLTLLDVDLEAKEGFSMNRDMVEQLLLSQYMGDVTGSRQMSRMLESVIGKDPQRGFDAARLTLGLQDERIAGYAKLESDALDLTVDIMADPLALLEALRVRQPN